MSIKIEKTSHLGSYIVLPVSDHTILPSLLPSETLQLQHTPGTAVYLESNIYYSEKEVQHCHSSRINRSVTFSKTEYLAT